MTDQSQRASDQPAGMAAARRSASPGRRALLTAGLLAVIAAIVLLSPLRQWLGNAQDARQTLQSLGWAAYPLSAAAVALLLAAGVPRVALCALGGMAYGFWTGLVLVQIASVIGYYAVFIFARWGGREWVQNRWPRLAHWGQAIGNQGMIGVVLVRQLPVHGSIINICLAMSDVGHAQFLVGTFIGLMPEAVPAAMIGAGLSDGYTPMAARALLIGAIALALLSVLCGRVIRRRHRRLERLFAEETVDHET